MSVRVVLAIVSGLAFAASAQGSPTASRAACMMTVLSPTPAVENAHAVIPKGTLWGPATQMRIGSADGHVTYCAHGDYCYPADHLRFVTPCTPNATPQRANAGDTERLYGLRGQPLH